MPWGALAFGLFSTVLIVLGGTLAGAAGNEPTQRLWTVPAIPVRPRVDLLAALVVFYAGLIFLVRAWLKLRRDLRGRRASAAVVALVVSVWALPLLAGPPLGSRDVYAYAAQGRLADEGFDVYRQGPAALGDDPVLGPVDPLYLDAPVVYGPVFVAVSSLVSSTVGSREESSPAEQLVHQVLAFRALAVLGLAVTAVGVWHIARSLGRDPVDAIVLAVANPLVLLHLVSGAHNEALMLAFLVGGVAIGLRPRWRLVGIALCAFAAAIKMPGILGAAFLAWPWVLEAGRPSRRVVRAVVAGGEAFAVIALSGRVTGWGWGWIDALMNAAPADAYLSVTRVLGGAVHFVTGVDAGRVLSAARMSGLLLAAVFTAWLLFRRKGSAVTALAWSLLLLAVLHPTTQPWYLTWGLMLWAAASAGNPNRAYLTVTAVAAFVVLPVGPQAGVVLLENNGVVSLLLAALALGLLTFSPSAAAGRGPHRATTSRSPSPQCRVTLIVPTRNEAESV
ncbi:MAG: polyprenol phosphomannose-dependent alpha 1,6 mannosyltransferase MptB, partial [Actinomycetota bacterium]|nr:polyprenol phosphomannose-dependent alpha 1,6 mannosyltransferase MptB [Actinomycetota bacterium]